MKSDKSAWQVVIVTACFIYMGPAHPTAGKGLVLR